MVEVLCTCNLVLKKPFKTASFGPPTATISFTGTRLEEMDTADSFKRYHDKEELLAKVRSALYEDNLSIATPATQLIKLLNIWTATIEGYT